jgi:hypothetical protein
MSNYEQVNAEYSGEAIYGVEDETETPFSHLKGYEFEVFLSGKKSRYFFSILSVFFCSVLSAAAASILCLANMGMISGINEIFDYFGIVF